MRHIIKCRCCKLRGPHGGRGLIEYCHHRHYVDGTLDRFPELEVGSYELAQYERLDAAGYSRRQIAYQLGVGRHRVRQIERVLTELKEVS